MKNVLLATLILHCLTGFAQLQLDVSSPLIGNPGCDMGCDFTSATTLSIQAAQADDGTTSGAASFKATDFNSTVGGLISIDYPNAQLATGSQNGFVTYTGSQTFGGAKTFADRTFFSDGLENAPSLSFSSNTNGSGFSYTNSTKTVFLSLDGAYNFQFVKGQLDITSGADFIGGANHLNINIAHLVQSAPNDQDGGISVSTYANGTTHTCTFAGRTANGTETTPTQSLLNDRLAEFSGKGFYSDGMGGSDWDPSNRVVFGAYAAESHTTSAQGAFCAIATTTKGDNTNHISMIIDDKGNAGLTDQKFLTTSLPTNFGTAKSDRFFSIQTTNNSKDAGLFIQSKTADKGMDIWLDNSLSKTFLDNIENSDAAIVQMRMKAYSGATTPVITMTANGYGTNFGGGTPVSGEVFSVGANRDFTVNSSGKISKYQNATISDGDLLIGKTSGSTFEKTTLTGSSGITVTNGSGSITLSGFGYTEQFSFGQFNPNDGTTYYGGGQVQSSGTTAGVSRIYIPKTGTIKACYVVFDNSGTLGSAETSTISIRLNNTTDNTISSSVSNDTRPTVFSNTSMSVSVSAGDYIEIKWVTPTWTTNPTSVRISGTLYIE